MSPSSRYYHHSTTNCRYCASRRTNGTGVVNEVALVEALNSNKLAFAGLDTFENEPTPAVQLLMNPKISLTPHIGAATNQAQDRIGSELAAQIISILK